MIDFNEWDISELPKKEKDSVAWYLNLYLCDDNLTFFVIITNKNKEISGIYYSYSSITKGNKVKTLYVNLIESNGEFIAHNVYDYCDYFILIKRGKSHPSKNDIIKAYNNLINIYDIHNVVDAIFKFINR